MPRTTQRAATHAPRVRTQPGGSDSDTALTQAHWCATRLLHHGWRFTRFGPGVATALTPAGDTVEMSDTAAPPHRTLHHDLCAALRTLGEANARPLAHLEVMLRLRVPITARPEQIHPWAIPGSTLAASATVRIGYWLATILSDDYRWQLVDFEASWFHAVPTDEDGLQRFTAAPPARRGRTPTSTLLAAHLATLNDAERRTLTELVTAHQRTPDRGAAPVINSDRPGLTG